MSKNDSKLLTKVSSLIPGQVPDFVESDHSLFVKFLKDYYQYLEAGRLTLTATVNYISLETTTVSYILSEDGDDNRIVTEIGEGSLSKFIEGETITGGTSNATATVLVDDIRNSYVYITSQQKVYHRGNCHWNYLWVLRNSFGVSCEPNTKYSTTIRIRKRR